MKEKGRERVEEQGIIIKLPAHTDKLSAVPLKKHSFQSTNIHLLESVGCFASLTSEGKTVFMCM